MRITGVSLLAVALCLWAGCGPAPGPESHAGLPFAGRRLELFVGSASQPAVEVLAREFEKRSGARLELHFGGSGAMLSQLALTGRGDVYLPGSSDYMELAIEKQLVDESSLVQVAFLLPAILVEPGNPENIQGLDDLGRKGLRLGIARPDTVCVGLYAVEVIVGSSRSVEVKENIVTHAESCAKTAQLIAMGQVDAVLGWRVFEAWNPGAIECVELAPVQVPRLGVIPAALTRQASEPEVAQAFLEFLSSAEGRRVFSAHGYLTTETEARALAEPDTPVGGSWKLPASWQP